jgi:hypothetical protein
VRAKYTITRFRMQLPPLPAQRSHIAPELLAKGVSVENVAANLGNTPAMILKVYGQWTPAKQLALDAAVKATWAYWFFPKCFFNNSFSSASIDLIRWFVGDLVKSGEAPERGGPTSIEARLGRRSPIGYATNLLILHGQRP